MSRELIINSSVHLTWEAGEDVAYTATIWLDTPERSVNVLNADMIDGLESAVAHIEESTNCSRVLIRSRKTGCFFAGADVNAIADLKCRSEAEAIIERGQQLFQRIASLKQTTVAFLQGTCLGGGLELALACDHRIAVDIQSTKLGLPEIKLGLIPGWGGTQRLPEIIGLQNAAELILTGSPKSAVKSLHLGLVDLCVEEGEFELARLSEFLEQISRKRNPTPSLKGWLLERTKLGRRILFGLARRQVGGRIQHYPALESALEVLKRGADLDWKAFDKEKEQFAKLLFTDTARSLLSLFLARDEARKASTWISNESVNPKTLPVRSVLVVGAGAMGAGIGTLAATKGYQVVFKEVHEHAAEQGRQRVLETMNKMVRRRQINQTQMEFCLDQMTFVDDWEATTHCDLAIEAVLEVEAVKKEVFEMLDRCLPADSTLTSNTSSLCVTRIATATNRRRQVAGLHFFNPVDRMDLVEIVQTESTSPETIARTFQFVKSLGKTPIITSDKPGFLVNRVLFPYLDEAMRMVLEGHDIKEIDNQMRAFGMPMGPLELMDKIGLDIAFHVAESQAEIHVDADASVELLQHMVKQGWMGKKSGCGFYKYETASPAVNERIPVEAVAPRLGIDFRDDSMTKTQKRLVYPILNEAVHCLDEQVVHQAWVVDLGLVLGTGFAPHHGGPLHLIDHIGVSTIYHNLCELSVHYGDRFRPADGITMAVRQGTQFFDDRLKNSNWEDENEPRIAQY
ncbi:MAG: 3-hydroxyacyl-CoA dehydrogenase NAD-binding domain-containing protein [Planctomycetota bacterium]